MSNHFFKMMHELIHLETEFLLMFQILFLTKKSYVCFAI